MKKTLIFSLAAVWAFAGTTADLLESADEEDALQIPQFVDASTDATSLNALIDEIIASNPKVQSALNAYDAARHEASAAQNYWLPSVDVRASMGYSRTSTDVAGSRVRPSAKGSVAGAEIVATENIFAGGADRANSAKQSALAQAAGANLIQLANDLAYESSKAYLELIKADLNLKIAQKNLTAHEEIYEQIKERTSSGYARASEERQAGSRLALARTNLLSAQNDYDDAKNTLAKFFGKEISSKNLVAPQINVTLPSDLEELNAASLSCNPSLAVRANNAVAAAEGIKEARAAFLPRVDGVVSAAHQEDRTKKEIDQDYKANKFEAKLVLNYNLFNKGIDKHRLEKAKLASLSAQSYQEDILRDIKESNAFAINSYQIAEEKKKYLDDYVNYSKETLTTYQDEFKLGKRDLLNLLDAQSEYFSAVRESVSVNTQAEIAKLKMLQNKGVLMDYFAPGFNAKYVATSCKYE